MNENKKQGRLIVLTGAPATGKTTWARKWVNEAPGRVRTASASHARKVVQKHPYLTVVLDPDGGGPVPACELVGLSFEVRHFECEKPINLPTRPGAVIRLPERDGARAVVLELCSRGLEEWWLIPGSTGGLRRHALVDVIRAEYDSEFDVLFAGVGF